VAFKSPIKYDYYVMDVEKHANLIEIRTPVLKFEAQVRLSVVTRLFRQRHTPKFVLELSTLNATDISDAMHSHSELVLSGYVLIVTQGSALLRFKDFLSVFQVPVRSRPFVHPITPMNSCTQMQAIGVKKRQ
jgi:hypothetical protein